MTRPRRSKEKTAELRLLDSLSYNEETGLFVWTKPPRRGVPSGSNAGTDHSMGYITIGYGGKQYFAHRLAWRIKHGAWPSQHIDHINGDKKDNRIANLRDVTRSVNSQNLRRATEKNQTGLLGVCHSGSKFKAQIGIGGTKKYIGMFDTAEEAHAAYLEKKRQFHEGCTI